MENDGYPFGKEDPERVKNFKAVLTYVRTASKYQCAVRCAVWNTLFTLRVYPALNPIDWALQRGEP